MSKTLFSACLIAALISCNSQKNDQEKENATTTTSSTSASSVPSVNTNTSTASNNTAVDEKPTSTIEVTAGSTTTGTANNTPTKPNTQGSSTTPKATSTAKINTTTSAPSRIGLTFLNEGETKNVEERGMKITFKRITEDSRCPQGVECVWAGMAVAELVLDAQEADPMTVQLSTTDTGNYQQSVNYYGYKISLKTVEPYPTSSNKNTLKGNYRIGLLFEKANPKKGSTIDPALIRNAPTK